MAFELLTGVKTNNPIPTDFWYGPYTSVANAIVIVPLSIRYQGRIVGVVEGGVAKQFWWKNGTSDIDLVEITGGSLYTASGGLTLTGNDFMLGGSNLLDSTILNANNTTDISKIFNSNITRTNGTRTTANVINRQSQSIFSTTQHVNSYVDATHDYSTFISSSASMSGASFSFELYDNQNLTSTIFGAGHNFFEIGINDDNLVLGSSIEFALSGVSIRDEINQVGILYQDDYSLLGSVDPLWIPNWGFVQDYVDNNTGSSYIIGNGLINNSGTLELGSLTKNTTLSAGGFSYQVGSNALGTRLKTSKEFIDRTFTSGKEFIFKKDDSTSTIYDSVLSIRKSGISSLFRDELGNSETIFELGSGTIEFTVYDPSLSGDAAYFNLLSSGYGGFYIENSGITYAIEVDASTGVNVSTGGLGLNYSDNSSVIGSLNPLWIPHWGYIDGKLTNKADLVGGLIPASQLPSFVDDVLDGTWVSTTVFNNPLSVAYTPESGKIYIDTTTNITYRWSGSVYVSIGSSLALGETSSTAYRGDRGKTAYDHSQLTHDKILVGLGNVVNLDTSTTTNISDSSNKRFITDSQQTILTNTSGTNSGDNATNTQYSGLVSSKEDSVNKSTSTSDSASSVKFPVWSVILSYFDLSRIKTILGITTLSGSNTGDETITTIQTKRPLKTINSVSLEGSGDIITDKIRTTITHTTSGILTIDLSTADIFDIVVNNTITEFRYSNGTLLKDYTFNFFRTSVANYQINSFEAGKYRFQASNIPTLTNMVGLGLTESLDIYNGVIDDKSGTNRMSFSESNDWRNN